MKCKYCDSSKKPDVFNTSEIWGIISTIKCPQCNKILDVNNIIVDIHLYNELWCSFLDISPPKSLYYTNYMNFGGVSEWQATPIQTNSNFMDLFMDRVILIYTGISRISSDIQRTLLENIESKAKAMNRMVELSRESKKIIENNSNLDLIGEMLDESWSIKREMNRAAVTPALDDFYIKAKSAGAIGGKVLGAGGGGFCMFWIKEGEKKSFLSKFNIGLNVPVKMSSHGSICL
jgi:D-glycero-alpha-D-manno-heptose-7-phosphate kinase